jgi:hypothetical protein
MDNGKERGETSLPRKIRYISYFLHFFFFYIFHNGPSLDIPFRSLDAETGRGETDGPSVPS